MNDDDSIDVIREAERIVYRGPAWAGTASGADSSKPTGPCSTKPGVQASRSRHC